MKSTHYSTEPLVWPQKETTESKDKSHLNPLLPQDLSVVRDGRLITRLRMTLPLILHFVGSVLVAAMMLFSLDGCQFYLERQPQVKLADGTYDYKLLGQYHLLQPDITTLLSGSLMILRWVASAWAIPLCWRVVFLIAGRDGLYYRDINWVTTYGIFPPTTHFRRPLALALGLILVATLAPYPSSPLLTGSIAWLPSTHIVDLPSHQTIKVIEVGSNDTHSHHSYWSFYRATFPAEVVKNFNTAWGRENEEHIFKRVVPSAAQLSIGSTIDSVIIPYLAVNRIEWFSRLDSDTFWLFQAMRRDHANFPKLTEQLIQPGAVAIIVNITRIQDRLDPPPTSWPVLINVGSELAPEFAFQTRDCNSTTTILPDNSTIPKFHLELLHTNSHDIILFGCFAYAKISFQAARGSCNNCRVVSPATVQNDTELEIAKDDHFIRASLDDMSQYIPTLTPLKNSLPDPTKSFEAYVTSFLSRLYSALWNSWTDANGQSSAQLSRRYKPAIPVLTAEINRARVYVWLTLQLLFTLAGLTFIRLQSRSRYPLFADTSMVAFDIDSTEAPKPSPSNNLLSTELLRIEPKEDGWRVVVVSGRSNRGSKELQ